MSIVSIQTQKGGFTGRRDLKSFYATVKVNHKAKGAKNTNKKAKKRSKKTFGKRK